MAERRPPLPQPRRHQLRLVQRALLRAGRLLRARRPLHRAADGRAGPRRDLRRLDPPLQGRRLPHRHRAPRRPGVLHALGAADPARRRARPACRDFELFGEVFVTDAVDLVRFVRDRGLPNVLDFPLQDAADALRRRVRRAPRGIAARLADDDYFRCRRASPTRRRRSSATTTWAAPRGMIRDRAPARAASRCCAASCSATTCSTSCAARRSSSTATRSGSSAAAATRRRARTCSRRRCASGRPRSASARRRSGRGSSFDVTGHPVAARLRTLGALRDAHPALSTGATRRPPRRRDRARGQPDRRGRTARVPRGVQRRHGAGARDGAAPRRRARAWTPLLGPAAGCRATADGDLTFDGAGARRPCCSAPRRRSRRRAPAAPAVQVAPRRPDRALARQRDSGRRGHGERLVRGQARPRRGWRRLAADDSPPYRAFLDPAGLPPRRDASTSSRSRAASTARSPSRPSCRRSSAARRSARTACRRARAEARAHATRPCRPRSGGRSHSRARRAARRSRSSSHTPGLAQ